MSRLKSTRCDLLRRAADRGQVVVELTREVDAPRPGLRVEAAHADVHDLRQPRLLQLERQRRRVDPGELEQVVDQQREEARLLAAAPAGSAPARHEPVLLGLEHRLDRRHAACAGRGSPRHELTPRVEQLLQVRGHLVEGAADVRELRAAPTSGARAWSSPPEIRPAAPASAAIRRASPRAEEQRGGDRGRRGGGRDREHLHVVVHVEHHQAGEDHRRERQRDRHQRQAGELEPHRRQPPQDEREHEPGRERAERDRERESGSRRQAVAAPRTRSRGGADATGSSSIFVRRRRTWTVTVPVSRAARVAPDAAPSAGRARTRAAGGAARNAEQVELLGRQRERRPGLAGPRGRRGRS